MRHEAADPTTWTATELSAAIHRRDVSCRDAMRAYLSRIESRNASLNAIVSRRDDELVLAEAAMCDDELVAGSSRGWMHGMPLAPKDLTDVAGMATTKGSPLLRSFIAREDSLVVSRMRRAGCVIVGKTNTPEFGLGSHTFNPVHGTTSNAYDSTKTAGGSSGGAAVALATSMLPVADGSDFMGSLRNPAGFNNVFGFRPSQGRVPSWPAVDVFTHQLATEGPMGRSVRDVARLLEIQAGPDPRVPLSIQQRFSVDVDDPFGRPIRVGWLGDLEGYLAVEPGVLATCGAALRRFESIGAAIETVTLPMPPETVWDAWLVWRRWLVGGGLSQLATAERRVQLKPEALWEIDQSRQLTGPDITGAAAVRSAFFQAMRSLFDRFDVLAIPSAQVWPFGVGQRWPATIGERVMDTYHRWMEVTIYATFAGLPCLCVPAGFSDAGLPMGLQLIGRPQGDAEVLRVGAAYESTIEDLHVGEA